MNQSSSNLGGDSLDGPRVFVSYSRETAEYQDWVAGLATRLREDGVDARLDRWHRVTGESVAAFMNREVRHAKKVLVLCSPSYREKVHQTEDGAGTTGSGWEAGLLADQVFQNIPGASKKCIPVLTRGGWLESAPDFLIGRNYIDLSDCAHFEEKYRELLQEITGQRSEAPPLGKLPQDLHPKALEALKGETTSEETLARKDASQQHHSSISRDITCQTSDLEKPKLSWQLFARLGPTPRGRLLEISVKLTLMLGSIALTYVLVAPFFPAITRHRPIVAVLDFDSLMEPQVWYATAIAELVDAHLAVGEKMYTVDRERLAELEWAFQRDPVLGEKHQLLRSSLGVTKVVQGSFEAQAGELQLSWLVMDVATGEQKVLSEVYAEPREKYPKLAREAAGGLREELGFAVEDSNESAKARALFPLDSEAARHYAKGLEEYRNFQTAEARESFEKALAIEGEHPIVLRALARTLIQLGYSDRAVGMIERARDLASEPPWVELLPWKEKREIEAEDHHFHGEWEEEAGVYSRLQERFPENVAYGRDRAEALAVAGQPAAALEILDELRKSSDHAARDGWIDLTAAEAHFLGGAADRALELARRAGEKGENSGDPFLEAQAKLKSAFLLAARGELEPSQRILEDARNVLSRLLAPREFFDECLITAYVYRQRGLLREAEEKLDICREIFRYRGFLQGEAAVVVGLTDILIQSSRLDEVEAIIMPLLTSEELDMRTRAGLHNNLGVVLHRGYRLREAWDAYEVAATSYALAGDPYYQAYTFVNLGELMLAGGFLELAERFFHRALETLADSDPPDPYATYTRSRLAEVYVAWDRSDDAHRIYDGIGPMSELPSAAKGEALLGRAKLALREDDYGTANAILKEAVSRLEDLELAALSRIVRARVYLATGDDDDELRELHLKICSDLQDHKTEWPRAGIAFKLLELRQQICAQADDLAPVEKLLSQLIEATERAVETGYVLAVIEARRELEELNLPGSEPFLAELDALIENGREAWRPQVARAADLLEPTP